MIKIKQRLKTNPKYYILKEWGLIRNKNILEVKITKEQVFSMYEDIKKEPFTKAFIFEIEKEVIK